MNYAQTLDYLYNKLPMFSRMGSAAYKKDLTNTRILLQELGDPQLAFRTIHVGGTNGKGSVSHMLAACLQTAGYKTGLYTSPHLFDFRERIKVNGAMADEDFVIRFTERIKPLIERIEPSFFEITVAMAFEYFREQGMDTAVVEVGLGGRLDSTNIIMPELSIITNIGWDHMNLLGDTLPAIAGEKAGIIKKGTPVVIGQRAEETFVVFEAKAREENAPIYFAEDLIDIREHSWVDGKLEVLYDDRETGISTRYQLELPGIYQLHNGRTVLQAIKLLQRSGYRIEREVIEYALANTVNLTGLFGRWQEIRKNPSVVLEVAHNKDGIGQMLQHLSSLRYRQLHIVTGMVKDKDVDAVLSLMPQEALYYFTQAQIPRALPAAELAEKAGQLGLQGNIYANVNKALEAATEAAGSEDLILVCGSIFLVAEVELHWRMPVSISEENDQYKNIQA